MNTPSTETLLELTNQVLMGGGDEPTRTLVETVAAKRAVQALKDALYDVSALGDWPHERDIVSPNAWDDVALTCTLNGVSQVNMVWVDGVRIPFVEYQLVAGRTAVQGELPTCWTQVSANVFRVAPYPTTTEQKALVLFEVSKWPTVPTLDTDTIPLPQYLIPPLVSRATGIFVLRHLQDAGLANQYNNEFEVRLQQARNLSSQVPRNSATMYPRR